MILFGTAKLVSPVEITITISGYSNSSIRITYGQLISLFISGIMMI